MPSDTLPVASATSSRSAREHRTTELFRLADQSTDDAVRERHLDAVIVLHIDVATSIAWSYRGRGLADDDLRQAGLEGLVKAVHRFDHRRGFGFMKYAAPTIRGEVQRYFRDHGWMVRPPRRTQDLYREVRETNAELTHRLGRQPTTVETAEALGVDEADVRSSAAATGAFRPISLDLPVGDRPDAPLHETLPMVDRGFSAMEARLVVNPLIRALSPRDRAVIYLRFFEEQSQDAIAAKLGMSQMQVSRLIVRVLADFRERIGSLDRLET